MSERNRPTGSGLGGVRPEASVGWASAKDSTEININMNQSAPAKSAESNATARDERNPSNEQTGTIIFNRGGMKNPWTGKRR